MDYEPRSITMFAAVYFISAIFVTQYANKGVLPENWNHVLSRVLTSFLIFVESVNVSLAAGKAAETGVDRVLWTWR